MRRQKWHVIYLDWGISKCRVLSILPHSKLTKFVKQNVTFDDFDLKSFLNWSDCCDGPM